MKNTVEIPTSSLYKMIFEPLDFISTEIADHEFDLKIVEGLIRQWVDSPVKLNIARALRELADELEKSK